MFESKNLISETVKEFRSGGVWVRYDMYSKSPDAYQLGVSREIRINGINQKESDVDLYFYGFS